MKSDGSETASLLRSIDFGVMTISGRCSSRLLAEHVEVVSWSRSCAVNASSAASWRKRSRRAEVVRTLALVAVRQEKHDARLLGPLRLTRGDELIDDRLRTIAKSPN